MTSTFSRMTFVALTLCLGLATGAASAGTPTITGWEDSADTGYNASFFNTGVTDKFDNWISFSMPADASGNGGSNAIHLGRGVLTFTAFNLYENAIKIATEIMDGPSYLLSFSGASTPGKYSLNIAGYKLDSALSASSAGNISIRTVPEPEAYPMLLAGLGLIGFSIRRRKSDKFQ